jgi:hypothetical protein
MRDPGTLHRQHPPIFARKATETSGFPAMRGRRKGWRHAGALHRDWQREIVIWECFNQGAQWGFGKGNKVLRLLRKAGLALVDI